MRRLLIALALLAPAPALADTLVDNINGISVERDGTVKRFAAMVIDDDGKIARLIERRGDAPRTDYREDGRGRTVIPGLIDSHAHVMGLGISLLSLDLSDTRSLAEAQARGIELPITEIVDLLYAKVQGMGGGREDTSALVRHLPEVRA